MDESPAPIRSLAGGASFIGGFAAPRGIGSVYPILTHFHSSASPTLSVPQANVEQGGYPSASFSVDELLPTVLFEQQFANLPIHFYPTELRSYHATLSIRTDQDAANGAFGRTFTYKLTGGGVSAVPEPGNFMLLALSCAGFWIRRR